jgi:hypothetical protein
MRSKIEKLHSAARQYCIEKSQYWRKQHYKLVQTDERHNSGSYSDEAYDLFPRYNCLNSILVGLEEFTPEDFSNFTEAKDLIILVGYASESLFTSTQNTIEKNAAHQEREAFCEYIENLDQEQIESIRPLFYRKVLTELQSQKLWDILKQQWAIQPKSYWYPLLESSVNDVIAFQEEPFDIDFGTENIRQILHLGHDAPSELLEAVNDLCIVNSNDKSKTKWISWDDEPGTYIWKLERQEETIIIDIYESKNIPKDRKQLDKEEIYRTNFVANGDFYGFIKEIAESFEKTKNLDNESKYYEREWRCKFPDAELSKLKSLIQTIKQKRGRNDGFRLNKKDMD